MNCVLIFDIDNKLMGDVLTHSISFLLLALLNCSNSVLVRGVYIDAEEPAGQCVIFPVYYVRLFFQKERTKKQKRLLDALEKMDENNVAPLLPDKKIMPTIVPAMGVVVANENEKQQKNGAGIPLVGSATVLEHTITRTDDV